MAMIQIRGEVANGLQAIFAKNDDVQTTLDSVVARGNDLIKRFADTYQKLVGAPPALSLAFCFPNAAIFCLDVHPPPWNHNPQSMNASSSS